MPSPDVCRRSVVRILRSVVFPAPFSPRSPKISPLFHGERETVKGSDGGVPTSMAASVGLMG
jgi:hypothetical protein